MRVSLAAVLLILASTVACAQNEERPKRPSPAFRAKTVEGESFTKESLKGKVVLIQFWATWCGYCRRDQPNVDQLISESKGKNLVVLAVSVNEDRQTVKDYLAKSPRTAKVVLTEDTDLTRHFPTRGFPTYVALDRDGNLAAAAEGAVGLDGLRELMERAGLN